MLADLFDFFRDPLAFYAAVGRRPGDVVSFRLGPYRIWLAKAPGPVREVLMGDGEVFRKGFGNDMLVPLMGKGLFLAEGERWKSHRRMLQPLFSTGNLRALEALAIRATDERLKQWPEGSPFDVHDALRELTLDVASRGLVGTGRFGSDPVIRENLTWLWDETNRQMGNPVPTAIRHALPLPSARRFQKRLRSLEAALGRVMDEAEAAEDASMRLLPLMMRSRGRAGQRLSRSEIRDEIVTFLLGGQVCTAISMAWTLHLLVTHPREMRRVESELDQYDPPSLARASLESMRLYPPAWILARQANIDTRLAGQGVPKNGIVLVIPWVSHRNPEVWNDPERFVPDRFLGAKPDPFAYLPFGAGPRTCIGKALALQLTRIVLPRVLRRYRLTPETQPPAVPAPLLTLRPKHGIWMRARRRDG